MFDARGGLLDGSTLNAHADLPIQRGQDVNNRPAVDHARAANAANGVTVALLRSFPPCSTLISTACR